LPYLFVDLTRHAWLLLQQLAHELVLFQAPGLYLRRRLLWLGLRFVLALHALLGLLLRQLLDQVPQLVGGGLPQQGEGKGGLLTYVQEDHCLVLWTDLP